MEYEIMRFESADGDGWYSVVENGDIVTGVMHADQESAVLEAYALQMPEE